MTRTVVARNALPDYLQAALDAGSQREVCPRCDGGTDRESSLSIRPDQGGEGVITMKCFRASCGWFGITLLDGTVQYDLKKIKLGNVYRDPILTLAGNCASNLIVDYGLNPEQWREHGWGMNEARNALVMPIRDHYGRERGHITRTVYEDKKRVYTYKATAQPFLDWWFTELNTAPVVVVEDALSACRLSGLGYNAVALLGTGMSQADAREIAQVAGSRPIYLALDRDAFQTALKLRQRHLTILTFTKIICLDEDIKNVDSDDRIREILDGRNTTTRSDLRVEEGV